MQIQINTDRHIQGREDVSARVQEIITSYLQIYSEQITRVEVHLSDANGTKSGADDKRCLLEARLAGLQPIAVKAESDNLQQAVQSACEKLLASLRTITGRRKGH